MKSANGLYPWDFYILRMPVYPVEYVLVLNELFLSLDYPVEGQHTIQSIKERFSDPLFIEAVFYASKELFKLLIEWLKAPVYDKSSLKMLKSLHRYYSRMCTRCTPFGLFAGCCVGEIKASATELTFEIENSIKRHIRPDASMLAALANHLSKNDQFNRHIKFRLNDMLYRRNGKLAFLECVWNGSGHSYTISALSVTKYLDFIISVIDHGRYVNELISMLEQFDNSIPGHRYEKYVQDLIACQFLTSELIPNVTGEDYGNRLMNIFSTNPHFNDINSALINAHRISTAPIKQEQYYIELQNDLAPIQKIAGTKEALQLDTYFEFSNNVINKNIVEEIVQTSEELWRINSVTNSNDLNEFVKRFKARYEDQAIPVLTALDSDIGIGYGVAINGNTENMPLLTGIAFHSNEMQEQRNKTRFQEFVSKTYETFRENKQPVIYLKDSEIAEFFNKNGSKDPENIQHSSAFIFGTILSGSGTELDKGTYKFAAWQLHNHSAGRMFGRFASGDSKIHELLLSSSQKEDDLNADVIIAEVVHAPTGHALNVVTRSAVRKYEIPIFCQPAVEDDFVIPIQDLLIAIRGNRVILFSQKHNKEVIPQITNSFNSQKGEPVYRFLADMAAQCTRPFFQWNWFDFSGKIFLPRIEYKKFILSRARWVLNQVEFTENKSDTQIQAYFNEIKNRYSIPRYVVMLQDNDNELLVDTENSFCLSHLIRAIKKRSVILVEYLNTPENCFITSGNFHFNNQVVIPLGTDRRAFPALSHNEISSLKRSTKRNFAPASSWLYFKVYGGNKTLDLMIPSLLKPLTEDLIEKGIADKCFFIRYNDPNSHLRIRFHCPNGGFKEVTDQFNTLLSPLIENNELDRFLIDTYKREVERYGADFIEESETLFFNDSIAVMNILDSIDGEAGDEIRWWAALKSVDSLLNDFGLNISEKQSLLQSLSQTFFREFSTGDVVLDKKLKVSLNNKYRIDSSDVANALNNKQLLDSFLFSVFEQRSAANKKTVGRISDKIGFDNNHGKVPAEFLKSHIHMNLNRLLISQSRKHEMVVYHYLNEFYKSQIAIQKSKSKASQNV